MMTELIQEEINNETYEVKPCGTLTLNIASFDDFKNRKILVVLHENSTLDLAFADFSRNSGFVNIDVKLKEQGAKAYIDIASLCKEKDKKKIEVEVTHEVGETTAYVNMNGIVTEAGHLAFLGKNIILKGAKKAVTRQDDRVVIFNKDGTAQANPMLVIDENDVQAGHGAAVGRLNERELFYFTCRGISEDEARKLLAFSYLKPITRHFKESKKEEILNKIEGSLSHV